MTKEPTLSRLSIVDSMVDTLRTAIASGELTGGQRLVEADLTERFHVSRGPVREAIRRLAAEGLIDMEYHRGARVRQMSRREVLALFEVREMLEGLSARLAAESPLDAESRGQIEALRDAMNAAVDEGNVGGYVALNSEFHNLVVRLGNNPHLPAMLAQLHTQAMRFQFRQLVDQAATADSHREHHRIINAILDGDADYAERSMRQHIQRSRRLMTLLPDEMFAPG